MDSQNQNQPSVTVDNYVETPEMLQTFHDRAIRNIRATNIPEINLAEEELYSKGIYTDENGNEHRGELKFAVVSFLTPAFGHVCTGGAYGMKLYSAHVTQEEATRFAKKLSEYHKELYGYNIYSIMVMEMGKLITIPHDRETLNKLWTNKQQSDEYLNELISNYRIEQEKSNIRFEERKNTLINAAKEFSALEKAKYLREQAALEDSQNTEGAGAGNVNVQGSENSINYSTSIGTVLKQNDIVENEN
jgi:hypothetical protein